MHAAIAGVPLLALDMYEHSFHMDCGAAASVEPQGWRTRAEAP